MPKNRRPVQPQDKLTRFEECMLPHINGAYNLARWLTGSHEEAQDVVQEAYLHAFKSFDEFRGGNSRSWVFRIIRNAFYDALRHKQHQRLVPMPEDMTQGVVDPSPSPDVNLLQKADGELLNQAIAVLPVEYREVFVMRELEDCSYREIAEVAGVPLGTVMSRLARAREQVRKHLLERLQKEEP
jgi:RNA polymerase sigma-70 factor (ECF subfamily)